MLRPLTCIFCAAAVLSTAWSAANAEPMRGTLVIRTYNAFGVPSQELRTAHRIVDSLLTRVGIETKWRDCRIVGRESSRSDDACADTVATNEVIVRIVRGPDESLDGGSPLGYSAVDVLLRRGTLATIYADRVVRIAHSLFVDRGTLLGRAVAHEIGHLLLGVNEHSSSGLMRGVWSGHLLIANRDEDWLFSSDQADGMRSALVLRAASAVLAQRAPRQGGRAPNGPSAKHR